MDPNTLTRTLEWTQLVAGILSLGTTIWSWQDAIAYYLWAEGAYRQNGHVETARQHEVVERLRLLCQLALIIYAVTGIVLPERLGDYAGLILLRKLIILGLIVAMGLWSYTTARWRVRMRRH
jgi:hypothetical protein